MEDEADLTGATPRRRPKPDVLEIGGRKLKPATLMMGHGFDPALSEGSLKPPIFLTSTFVFESAAAGKRHFEGVTGKRPGGAEGLIYSRFNGPNQEILEDRLGVWEDAEDALSFSSGMSAITTLILTHVQPGDVVVHSGPLYAATETLIGRILGRFCVQWLDFPAGATGDEIAGDVLVCTETRLGNGGVAVDRDAATLRLIVHHEQVLGLVRGDRLPTPIFTPATKAEQGAHDENISFERACDIGGQIRSRLAGIEARSDTVPIANVLSSCPV